MKKKEVLTLFEALKTVGNLSGIKFSYAIARNVNFLKAEVEALLKAREPYEIARIKLAEQYAIKDEQGKPIVIMGNQYAITDQKKFNEALDKVKVEYKDAEFQAFLDTESEAKIYKIKLEDVPEAITTDQMTGIYPIIEE